MLHTSDLSQIMYLNWWVSNGAFWLNNVSVGHIANTQRTLDVVGARSFGRAGPDVGRMVMFKIKRR